MREFSVRLRKHFNLLPEQYQRLSPKSELHVIWLAITSHQNITFPLEFPPLPV